MFKVKIIIVINYMRFCFKSPFNEKSKD